MFGLDPSEFPERQFVIVKGNPAQGNQVLVGDHAASSLGLAPGDTITIGNAKLPVAGIYHSGNSFEDGGVVAPLALVQQWAGRPGEVTSIGIIVRPGVASSQLATQLERRYPGLVAITNPGQAMQVDTTSKLLISAGWVFSVVALLVGGIGVTNTMAMSVMERSQEIGVLRAVGWPNRRVAGMIASEARDDLPARARDRAPAGLDRRPGPGRPGCAVGPGEPAVRAGACSPGGWRSRSGSG